MKTPLQHNLSVMDASTPLMRYDGKQDFNEVEKRFKAMGFDRAFGPGTAPETTIAALKEDLKVEG